MWVSLCGGQLRVCHSRITWGCLAPELVASSPTRLQGPPASRGHPLEAKGGVWETRGHLPSVRTEQDEKPWVLGLLVEVGDEDRCREKGLRRVLAWAARGGREGDQRGGARRPAPPPEDARGEPAETGLHPSPWKPEPPRGAPDPAQSGRGWRRARLQPGLLSLLTPAPRLPGCPALGFLRLSAASLTSWWQPLPTATLVPSQHPGASLSRRFWPQRARETRDLTKRVPQWPNLRDGLNSCLP